MMCDLDECPTCALEADDLEAEYAHVGRCLTMALVLSCSALISLGLIGLALVKVASWLGR